MAGACARRVTLLGGTGFVGRALAARLAAEGTRVRAASRQAHLADLPDGVDPFAADVRDPDQLRNATAGADVVVYLPGIVQARSHAVFQALHVEAPRNCAEICRRAGVGRFVMISALGVGEDAPSMADRSKAEGERAVREAFPGTTVVRPSLVFGVGDHFISQTARMLRALPVYPLIGGGGTRFQPVHVNDLAQALAAVAGHPGAAGQTYEIGGARIYTLRALAELIRTAARTRCWLPSLPHGPSWLLAAICEALPKPPLTRDQLRLLMTDKTVGGRHAGLRELGIAPRALEHELPAIVATALRTSPDPA